MFLLALLSCRPAPAPGPPPPEGCPAPGPDLPHAVRPHEVHQALSPDGVVFTELPGPVLAPASVPEVLRLPDGGLRLYAINGTPGNFSRSTPNFL